MPVEHRLDAVRPRRLSVGRRLHRQHGHSDLPAQPIHVALYLTHLLNHGASDGVVSSAFYGIKWAHRTLGLFDPTANEFTSALLGSARRTAHKPVAKKFPVTSEMLINLCTIHARSLDLLIIRDLAMVLLSFADFYGSTSSAI